MSDLALRVAAVIEDELPGDSESDVRPSTSDSDSKQWVDVRSIRSMYANVYKAILEREDAFATRFEARHVQHDGEDFDRIWFSEATVEEREITKTFQTVVPVDS